MRTALRWLPLLLCATLQAAEFRVTAEGRDVADAEICLFRAGSNATPVTRFLMSADLSCLPAGADVPVPSGDWNVFARKGSELISERVELVSDRTRPAELALVPAAHLDRSRWPLAKDERLFVYIPRSGTAMPLHGAVPAGTVIPLVVAGGTIVDVGVPLELAPGESRRVEPSPRQERSNLVVPLFFKATPDGVDDPPRITLTDAKGGEHVNAAPLKRAEAGAGALAIFRGLGAGTATVRLSGPRWATAEAAVDVKESVEILERPLVAHPASNLTVHWWSAVDLSTLRPPESECDVEPDQVGTVSVSKAKTFTATIMICPDEPKPIPMKCKSATEVELPMGELRGQAEFTGVPVGRHFVTFAYPGLPSVLQRAEVFDRADSTADVELRYFAFFGKVTRGDEPVHGRVFGTVTEPDTGRFVAVMSRAPSAGVPFGVTFCDGSGVYRFVSDEPPKENAEFNIEIPANRVIVQVTDQATGAPLANAQVSLGAMHRGEDDAAHYAGPAGKTDGQGRLVIEPILANRELHICAGHPDYDSTCAERFEMKEQREKIVSLALEKAVIRRGRIRSGAPAGARLVWFSRDGRITEMIWEFSPDGEFTYKKPHAEGEIVALISDQPLYVFHHPRLRDDDLFEIVIPLARPRSFSVTLSAESREESGWVALQIGEVIATINTVGWHLMQRRIQSILRPGWTVHIPDILETGPITVIFVPVSAMAPYRNPRVELPLVPEFGSFPRQRLGDDDNVIFP
ncbi:MAG TPA: hypothetical protein VM779_12170 [Thermoanaerobaculia bacterium]|nr:hypothetical protein [Thermoanaerobaculia bacterium]